MIDTLNKDQLACFNRMIKGENLFVTGEAGTGKSYVTNAFIDWCKANGKSVVVCAPTGIAALHIGGVTMHRLFKLPLGIAQPLKKVNGNDVLKNADVVVIDEISMCRFDMFARAVRVLKASNPRAQLVCVGDFYQLPPVVTDDDAHHIRVLGMMHEDLLKNETFYAFVSPHWKKVGMQTVKLKQQQRQSNKAMIRALNQIRIGDKKGIAYFNKNAKKKLNDSAITLCTTNRMMNEINQRELNKIDEPAFIYRSEVTGTVQSQDKAVDDTITLKVGAKVRFAINDEHGRWVNGTEGTIRHLAKEGIRVEVNGISFDVEKHEWEIEQYVVQENKGKKVLLKETIGTFTQYPLKLAYAITIHKSQGQSYDELNIQLGNGCFANGQLYVALSRAKNIEGLALGHPIKETDLLVSEHVHKFMDIRGGKREGAGRKNSKWMKGTELKTMKVPVDLYEKIMEYAQKLHYSLPEFQQNENDAQKKYDELKDELQRAKAIGPKCSLNRKRRIQTLEVLIGNLIKDNPNIVL